MVQEDNLELHYTTNFLHMALFIQELGINNNKMSDGGRIIVTGSFTAWTMAKGALNLQDFGTPEGPTFCVNFGMGYTYSQSKLAQHMYVKHLTNSGNTGAETRMGLHDSITVNIVCPGAVVVSILPLRSLLWPMVVNFMTILTQPCSLAITLSLSLFGLRYHHIPSTHSQFPPILIHSYSTP